MKKITVKEMRHDGLVDAVATTASFMRRYRAAALVLGIILVAGAVIFAAVSYHTAGTIARAETELGAARSREDLRAVFDRYPDTPAAPLALIQLAAALYDAGEFDQARDTYRLFIGRYAAHRLAPFAQMGAAYCLESAGKLEEALAGYGRIGERYPGSSLEPEAGVNRGRCLVRLGRYDEALEAYRSVIERFPRTMYAGLAREELVSLLSEIST
ncbi:MAG: tetratricopeptide repeat protein [PVC group bacterium]